MDYKRGLDVSHSEGKINWSNLAKAGYYFGITKATEGISLVDEQFVSNWKNISSNLKMRGAYHYAHPEEDMGVQGVFFAKTVGALKSTDSVFVDIEATFHSSDPKTDLWLEYNESTRRLKLDHFLAAADDEFTKLSGHSVLTGIYTDPGNWNEYFSSSYDHSNRKLWLAEITSSVPKPIGAWKKINLWQYNWQGEIAGVGSGLDLNYWIND